MLILALGSEATSIIPQLRLLGLCIHTKLWQFHNVCEDGFLLRGVYPRPTDFLLHLPAVLPFSQG